MAQEATKPGRDKEPGNGHPVLRGLVALATAGGIAFGGYQLLVHPDTPLPRHWNPTQPLIVSDPVTPITNFKLNRATAEGPTCLAALSDAAVLTKLADFEHSDQCHVRERVDLRSVGQSSLGGLETRCAIALRMAMWEEHSLQPAAAEHLGTTLTAIDHFGSYNCRRLRTSSGPSARMSTHATADAIDVSGFVFADGRRANLRSDWDSGGDTAAFLRAARDGACEWFRLTLSPDYNRLHADHFHLQSIGWGLCR